jgi:hypothetical protein
MTGKISCLATSRKSRRSSPKPLISLTCGSRAEVRKSVRKSLISLASSAAAELPLIPPTAPCARLTAARMRVQVFVR